MWPLMSILRMHDALKSTNITCMNQVNVNCIVVSIVENKLSALKHRQYLLYVAFSGKTA